MTLNKNNLFTIIGLAIVAQIILLYLYFSTFSGSLPAEHEVWGQLGDYIGGIMNPIVGLFTLLIVASAYLLQRKELIGTTNALKGSAKASVIKSKIDIETALLQDAIGRCNRIHADFQRVADARVKNSTADMKTYKFNGEELEIKSIQTYLINRRGMYEQVRENIAKIKKRLEQLQSELTKIESS